MCPATDWQPVWLFRVDCCAIALNQNMYTILVERVHCCWVLKLYLQIFKEHFLKNSKGLHARVIFALKMTQDEINHQSAHPVPAAGFTHASVQCGRHIARSLPSLNIQRTSFYFT